MTPFIKPFAQERATPISRAVMDNASAKRRRWPGREVALSHANGSLAALITRQPAYGTYFAVPEVQASGATLSSRVPASLGSYHFCIQAWLGRRRVEELPNCVQ